MNENNDYNDSNIKPYKAKGNLNTAIGNPSVNINDTMNINIQNLATNQANINNNQNNNIQMPTNTQVPINNNQITNNTTNNSVDTNTNPSNQNNSNTKKTYVSATNNKPKKKNMSLNLGPEFKIALLITVILLVFIFLLPMISDFIRGY